MSRLFAEYRDPEALLAAIRTLREAGHEPIEAYTPYPVPGLDDALGRRRSRLSIVVLAVGLGAAAGGYGLQWLLNAYLYPLDVGGRPPHLPVAFVPITFEMGVLFAATTALLAVIVLGRLLRLHDPVFDLPGFESASRDHFWLEVPPGAREALGATDTFSVAALEDRP